MATKYQLITELYQSTLDGMTSTQEAWQDFLRSACNNYKCRFDEQVLIYAQRPDAKAVLEIERWNKLFGRWVNRGSTGIAVFDDTHNGRSRLKHYFDISDTHAGRFSRSVPMWQMEKSYEDEVIETLENSFGTLEFKESLDTALTSAVSNVLEDNYQDYLDELLTCRDDSFLEELDERTVKVYFKNALEDSVSFMLLERCLGNAATEYVQDMDFSLIHNFNTRGTINALGIATSDMAEMLLKEVSLTISSIQKREQTTNRTFDNFKESDYSVNKQQSQPERSFEDGTDLQQTGRLQSAQPSTAPGVGASPWQIRFDAPDIPEGKPQSDLHQPADSGQTEQPSDGNRADGINQTGAADHTDGEGRGRDGADERHRPDEMGGADEQHPAGSGGNDSDRADLQLTDEEQERQTEEAGNDSLTDSDELPAFLEEALFMGIIANKDDDLIYKKSQIELFFSLHPEETKRAEYLKSAYQDRFTEIFVDGQRVGYKPQEDGLLMWKGAYLSHSEESVLSWGIIAELVSQLIDQKEYFINTDIKALKDQSSQQMSLFDYGDFNTQKSDDNGQLPMFKGFTISQQIIDEALCLGGNEPKSLERICAYFAKDYPLEQNAAFLWQEYKRDGKGFYSGSHLISLWFDENGIRIAEGKTTDSSRITVLSWDDAAKRIRELLDMGRYAPQSVLDSADANEREDLSATLWYHVQDFSEQARDSGLLPTIRESYDSHGGFPDSTAQIKELLKAPAHVDILIGEMTEFIEAYEGNRDLLRFHFHRPRQTVERLQGLQSQQLVFTAHPDFSFEPKQFITNDEIDKLFIGGGNVQDNKFRIYSYFLAEHTPKERADFLKAEYGTGGSGRSGFHTNYDSKGIEYSRGDLFHPYDKVHLKWSQVKKRIGELIRQNRYMTEKELAYIPSYERNELAREVYSFFYNVPQEQPHPYPYGFDHYAAVPIVEKLLGDPAKVSELYQMMLPVWENMALDDRYYSIRQRAFEHLTAYREGTFSLFGEIKAPAAPPIEKEQPPEEKIPGLHAEPEAATTDKLVVGTRLTIDDKEFEIDSVNEEWDKVSLRDVTFQNGTGFPIFRSESIPFVREALAAQEEQKQLNELVSDRLSESGWTVTDELVSNGIRDFHAEVGKGNDEEIADFIQDEFLSTETEPELFARTLDSSVSEDLHMGHITMI